jgi:hypothetical protein
MVSRSNRYELEMIAKIEKKGLESLIGDDVMLNDLSRLSNAYKSLSEISRQSNSAPRNDEYGMMKWGAMAD